MVVEEDQRTATQQVHGFLGQQVVPATVAPANRGHMDATLRRQVDQSSIRQPYTLRRLVSIKGVGGAVGYGRVWQGMAGMAG